eukprot:NODE_30_length_32972_cov_0.541052.p6 type:complete len:508 gc:universal NODE_30_length_32972_cov_0.541052:15725-17248(+)
MAGHLRTKLAELTKEKLELIEIYYGGIKMIGGELLVANAIYEYRYSTDQKESFKTTTKQAKDILSRSKQKEIPELIKTFSSQSVDINDEALTSASDELQMQSAIIDFLKNLCEEKCLLSFHDTSAKPIIGSNRKPDVTCVSKSITGHPSLSMVVTVIELKFEWDKSSSKKYKEAVQQAYTFAEEVFKCQPSRSMFYAIVTDIKETQIWKYFNGKSKLECQCSQLLDWTSAKPVIKHLLTQSLMELGFTKCLTSSIGNISDIESIKAKYSNSSARVFRCRYKDSEQIVLKCRFSSMLIDYERKVMNELIHDNIAKSSEVFKGIIDFVHYHYIQIRPCGQVFDREHKAIANDVYTKLKGALEFAHKSGYCHRDVKPMNIVIHTDNTPILIDWELAVESDTDVEFELSFTWAFASDEYLKLIFQTEKANFKKEYDFDSLLYSIIYVKIDLWPTIRLESIESVKNFIQKRQKIVDNILNREPEFRELVNPRINNDLDIVPKMDGLKILDTK